MRAILWVCLTVGISSGAFAQEAGTRRTREFVQAAAQSDTFEIMEAQTALAESHDPQVLAFARRILQDHQATFNALSRAAEQAGLQPPVPAVGAAQAPFLATLQSMRGQQFDQTFWRQQMLAHHSAMVVEQGYARAGDNPVVRDAARSAVPVIQAHLSVASRMAPTG